MSSVNTTAFICQESFKADNTTSCLRYPKLKRCVREGTDNHLNFLCVDHNSIAIGGSGPVPLPAPTDVNMTVFFCSMDSCPLEAPPDTTPKKKKGDQSTAAADGSMATATDRRLTMSGYFVLALVVSQFLLF
ncbi:hypothetical protein BGZ99_005480 [Dissophora globulifera]|uniref:Uncharacterized protein n=1 Tax=Dissophora globulifera TaxID=979702 RepID=A0A9P6USE7_9FUNG|nr:hypothetical protein BGZ99_005480 [Dissophora globulifera]